MTAKIYKATEADFSVKKGAPPKWPLDQLEVGYAIDIKVGEYGSSSPSTYPHTYGKSCGKKFSVRKISKGLYRVVRVG